MRRRHFSRSSIATAPARPPPLYLAILTLTFLTLFTTVLSTTPTLPITNLNLISPHPQNAADLAPRTTKPFLLRIMPLGASITVGYQSSDGNGYRKPLREQLRFAGWEVDMVGSLVNGTMLDHQNEGHFGDTIDGVAKAAIRSVDMQPNIVLINVGTNDAIQNVYISGAGARIDTLITDLFTRIPNTTVILSTLIPNTHVQRVVERISQEYRNVASRRRAQGERVVLAEMSYFIGSERLVDGTHPDDTGYKEMAAVWWAAISTAESEGLLERANGVGKAMAVLTGGNGTRQEGAGLDDGGVVEDPGLPAYIAPAQPSGDTGGAAARWGVGIGRGEVVWMVGVLGIGEFLTSDTSGLCVGFD
ncbi:SGNH hydrolase-type esterase domain-containing protein [Aspergillus cavernicola]|uniref:SGNH hydrolase-type esterase domain-containing protein n=1 Tax=Aspergillus cavernicola TaxID=176166 RepID=A0ABR4IXR5_9EURO